MNYLTLYGLSSQNLDDGYRPINLRDSFTEFIQREDYWLSFVEQCMEKSATPSF